jgi:hypothetical protein
VHPLAYELGKLRAISRLRSSQAEGGSHVDARVKWSASALHAMKVVRLTPNIGVLVRIYLVQAIRLVKADSTMPSGFRVGEVRGRRSGRGSPF